MSEELRRAALDYHRFPKPGKLEIKATKPLANSRDLSLAYSPGVAAACLEIDRDPTSAAYVGEIVPYDAALTPAHAHFIHQPMDCEGCLGACHLPAVDGTFVSLPASSRAIARPTATLESREGNIARFQVETKNQDGTTVLSGYAEAKVD